MLKNVNEHKMLEQKEKVANTGSPILNKTVHNVSRTPHC